MKQNKFPKEWDKNRVHRVLAHYEKQTGEEALAGDEADYEDRTQTTIDIPVELVLAERELIAKHQTLLHPKTTADKKPEEKRPQFVIKAVLFPGNSPAVSEYKDSRDISGNIPKIFEAGRSFLINNL